MLWWILGVLILWLLLRAAMRTSAASSPAPSTRDFSKGSVPHPGLSLPLATLELAVTARHPGEQILARYPARIMARGEEPVNVGELSLGSSRIHWTSYTSSGHGIAAGLALELRALIAIRSRQCDIDFYVDQNVVDQDGLATRFSFRVEPDNSALADFFTNFSQQYTRATGEAFRNLDDEQLARVPVLDWSEQISVPR